MFEVSSDSKSLVLVCPRGNPALEGLIKIEISEVKRLEARINEVAFVNPHRAPELLATFNKVCLDLSEYTTMLESERLAAERAIEKRRAVILTDYMPKLLEDKKLKDSKDNRDALLKLDEQLEALQDRYDKIDIAIKFLKTKYDGFEMAYQSVKKIIGENNYNHRNPNHSAGGTTGELGDTVKPTGYGHSQY